MEYNKPLIIGHRGLQKLYLENTLESILSTVDSKYCDGVEFDIWATKDNYLIIYHDPVLDRFIYKDDHYKKYCVNKEIKDLTWQQISKLTLNNYDDVSNINNYIHDYKITRLDHLLNFNILSESKILINIELKDIKSASILPKLINNLIDEGKYKTNRFLFSSFCDKILNRFLENNIQNKYILNTGKLFSPDNIGELDLYISPKCRLKDNTLSHLIDNISILIFEDILLEDKNFPITDIKKYYKIFIYGNNYSKNIVDGIICDYPHLVYN